MKRSRPRSEPTEPTFVPSLTGRSQRQSTVDDDSPTVVRDVGAIMNDMRRSRLERGEAKDAKRRAKSNRRLETTEITDITEVTDPPDMSRAMKASAVKATVNARPAKKSAKSTPRRDQPTPASARAGSLVVPATPEQAPAAPRATPTPARRVLEAVSLFEPSPARPTPPAQAVADLALPQMRQQEPAPAAPAPREQVDASPAQAVAAPKHKAAKKPRRSISMGFTFTIFFLVCGVLFLHGWDYYILDLDGRIEHPAYNALRPTGTHGSGYGVTGTVLIFPNLLYLARRRLARAKLGSMRTWLDLHVFTGVVGCAFIIFHSAFQLRSPLAVTTAVGFVVVMITGFIGRFLYALAPRVDESVMSNAVAQLEGQLPGIRPQIERAVHAHPIRDFGSIGLLSTLFALPVWRRTARQRRRTIRMVVENSSTVAALNRKLRRRARAASRQVERAAALEVRSHAAATLLQSWRSLHRFFALLMLMCVIVHVTMALHYGYHWIFTT